MPFTITNTAPSINPPPLVTVEFAGLMLLEGLNNTCEIGVHRLAPQHSFQVSLIVSRPQEPPTLIRVFMGPLDDDFEIGVIAVAPAPDPPDDFKAYQKAGPFVRDAATAGNNKLDSRWGLNLRELHAGAKRSNGASPIVKLKTGVLYTSTLTPADLNPELVKPGHTIPLYRFAADLGAAIQRPANTSIRLKWIEMGQERTLSLPRSSDPAGTTYVVSVMNDPPLSAPATHDEIAEYYKILKVQGSLIPAGDRWQLRYRGSFDRLDEIPCMPGTLEP